MCRRYAPAFYDIPLQLGSHFRPILTSGPNTYKDSHKESLGLVGKYMLYVYHTLPLDAAALLNQFGGLFLSGREFFEHRLLYACDSSYEQPMHLRGRLQLCSQSHSPTSIGEGRCERSLVDLGKRAAPATY